MDYNTPTCTKILAELGWVQFEGNPVYIRRFTGSDDMTHYQVSYSCDINGMEIMYEKAFNEGKITYENLKITLGRMFGGYTENNIMEEPDTLSYWTLLMITADFYWSHRDGENHQKYVNKFELLTGRKY